VSPPFPLTTAAATLQYSTLNLSTFQVTRLLRGVIPGTLSYWLRTKYEIPAGAPVTRSHGRRHPLEPVLRDFTNTCAPSPRQRSVPDSLSRTWHDPTRRHRARSPWGVSAPVRWKAPVFENVDHARRDWPRMRPADDSETQLQSSMQRRLLNASCRPAAIGSNRQQACLSPLVCSSAYAEPTTYYVL